MQWRSVDELCATALNVTSNVVMLVRMLQNPNQRVPRAVLVMQMLANVCWFSFAASHGPDLYLMTTSASSGVLQCLSVWLLARATNLHPPRRVPIREDRSTDTLVHTGRP
jgi:hypothetical protein